MKRFKTSKLLTTLLEHKERCRFVRPNQCGAFDCVICTYSGEFDHIFQKGQMPRGLCGRGAGGGGRGDCA